MKAFLGRKPSGGWRDSELRKTKDEEAMPRVGINEAKEHCEITTVSFPSWPYRRLCGRPVPSAVFPFGEIAAI
ncbi:hypothetical protein MUK42_11329 [Musa troglodytarum]|uniref:Uncharacterized protein n=1 Tax=Musa troglodytarum TaxID=320322 RepID=A0A9E7JY67_9LILI|nr:hypothetical protein MUK42_11329 [Musa troglodytarum]